MAGERAEDLWRVIWGIAALAALLGSAPPAVATGDSADPSLKPRFLTSDQCIACHSDMVDARGRALSIGSTWRGSIMAQSAKDPYWQAGVRREIAERPELQATIEDTCSVCHMPMFRTGAVAEGGRGEIVRYLEGGFSPAEHQIGGDGVSCTVCHQIEADTLGQHASFDGGYRIAPSPPGEGHALGPFAVDAGLQRVMRSASTLTPGEGLHLQRSELCATCHTLFTPAVNGAGETIGEFPEQVPYLEWKASAYRETQSCQDCHMPQVDGAAPATSVLGEPRENVSQHVFRGGNVFMLGLLVRYPTELGVTTPVAELQESLERTRAHLESAAAEVTISELEITDSEARFAVDVANLAGHKLPTAYPSRRAWLHVTVRDGGDRVLFESGAPAADGSITGNANDADAASFEPHYDLISRPDQVQIYEPIIWDHRDQVTTSLLSGVRYAKDNRLLPHGFDKESAEAAVAVRGGALGDQDFRAGGDRVHYRVPLPAQVTGVEISAELLYQTIGYRWADNLESFDSPETRRFVGYYRANAESSTVVLARASTR